MNKTAKEWAVGMLFMGVLLGIVGNLSANVLDRYFAERFGVAYDIFIVILFVFLIFWFYKKFEKILE